MILPSNCSPISVWPKIRLQAGLNASPEPGLRTGLWYWRIPETEILTLEVVTAAGSCSDTSKVFAGYSLIFDNITADTNFNIPEVSPCFSYTAQPVKNLGVFLTLSALPTEFTSVVVQKGGGIYVSN
ncbi:MAG: hypothetical protein UU26_C0003G0035 [Candidatus Daviesbacteria bacterium GW2011_GWC1_40_9]|nr:MAG: hypothetical protein UU26_C0003G0035 [Candidatus Daviesbacteria bacterium GW2011_GWC1_40_9]